MWKEWQTDFYVTQLKNLVDKFYRKGNYRGEKLAVSQLRTVHRFIPSALKQLCRVLLCIFITHCEMSCTLLLNKELSATRVWPMENSWIIKQHANYQ